MTRNNKSDIKTNNKINLMDLCGYLTKPSIALSIEDINNIIEGKNDVSITSEK